MRRKNYKSRLHNLIFIYSDGGVYSFDFSMTIDSSKDYSKTYFVNKLEILKQYSDPIAVLDEYDVKTLYAMSMEIGNNKSIDSYTENVAWDAGSNTLSFYNGKKLVTCRKTGDYEGELPGEVEKKLLKFYDEEITKKIYSTNENDDVEQVYLYTKMVKYRLNKIQRAL